MDVQLDRREQQIQLWNQGKQAGTIFMCLHPWFCEINILFHNYDRYQIINYYFTKDFYCGYT